MKRTAEVGIDHEVFLNSPHCEVCELLKLGLIEDYKHHHLCFLLEQLGSTILSQVALLSPG